MPRKISSSGLIRSQSLLFYNFAPVLVSVSGAIWFLIWDRTGVIFFLICAFCYNCGAIPKMEEKYKGV